MTNHPYVVGIGNVAFYVLVGAIALWGIVSLLVRATRNVYVANVIGCGWVVLSAVPVSWWFVAQLSYGFYPDLSVPSTFHNYSLLLLLVTAPLGYLTIQRAIKLPVRR